MANCSCYELGTLRFLWWNDATKLHFVLRMGRKMCTYEEWTQPGFIETEVVPPCFVWWHFLVSLRHCSLTCVVYNSDEWALEKHLVAILDWELPVKLSTNGSVAFVRSSLPQIYATISAPDWEAEIKHSDGLLGICLGKVIRQGKKIWMLIRCKLISGIAAVLGVWSMVGIPEQHPLQGRGL